MLQFSQVLEKAPQIEQAKMVQSGIGVWVAWGGKLDPTFNQTLSDYGGQLIADDLSQSLWFFFGEEAWYALARLNNWGRVNALPMLIEAFPSSILVSRKLEKSISVAGDLSRQNVIAPENIEIWVHPNLKNQLSGLPGMSTETAPAASGMSGAAWERFKADPDLAYESRLTWHFIIKPLGDPLDKNTSEGWRNIASEFTGLLEQYGLKYMTHDGYILFSIEGLRLFQKWCKASLALINALKHAGEEGGPTKYWPSVIVVVSAKNFNMGKDLPKKINLDWNNLSPDYPHMSYRAAFLLGGDFIINVARYAGRGASVEDWCAISLAASGEEEQEGVIALTYPSNLFSGEANNCYYCGMTNHGPKNCPSKQIRELNPGVWDILANYNIEKIDEKLQALDNALGDDSLASMASMLESDAKKHWLLRSIFEVDYPVQLRTLDVVWRSRGKDFPSGLSQVAVAEGEYIWDALEALRARDEERFEQLIGQALLRYSRGYQPRILQGFWAMESGDWTKAVYYWQEGMRLSYSAMQRSYCLFLQARAMEIQGDAHKAVALYKQSLTESPRWPEPVYRQGVCLVKMGFTDQAMSVFVDILRQHPKFFNHILVDPELERGRLGVLSALWKPWSEASQEAQEYIAALPALSVNIHKHFLEDNAFLLQADRDVQELGRIGSIQNYVAFKRLVQEFKSLQDDLKTNVDREIKNMHSKQMRQFEELKNVQREAAWFPFPKLLREFNKDFNFCAIKLNWMRSSSMQVAENFRKAQEYLPEVDERILALKKRLITLRIIRDATFFVMLLGRNFVWMEVLGLGLSLIFVPLFVYIFQQTGQSWVADMMERQKWQLQKGLIIVLSIAAMALAAIKTALSFDSKKRQLFDLAAQGKLPQKKKKKAPSKKAPAKTKSK